MRIDRSTRELHLKIALVGPASGRKLELANVFLPLATPRGKPHYVDSVYNAVMAGAVFLDFVPPEAPPIEGRTLRVHLHSTRPPEGDVAFEYMLDGADAVIFVADATNRDANLAALERVAWLEDSARPLLFVFERLVEGRPLFEGIEAAVDAAIAIVVRDDLDRRYWGQKT